MWGLQRCGGGACIYMNKVVCLAGRALWRVAGLLPASTSLGEGYFAAKLRSRDNRGRGQSWPDSLSLMVLLRSGLDLLVVLRARRSGDRRGGKFLQQHTEERTEG